MKHNKRFLQHLFYFISDVWTSAHLGKNKINAIRTINIISHLFYFNGLQCFEAIGWAAGRASGL